MRYANLFLLFFLIHIAAFAQSQDNDVYFFFPAGDNDVMPGFKGGETELYKYLVTNIHYPYAAREKGIQGTVYISFVIEKDGSLSNVVLLIGIGGGCDEEAIRVVKSMNGMWSPGIHEGVPVKVRFSLPVLFSLSSGSRSDGNASAAMDKGLKLMEDKKYEKALCYFDLYDENDFLYPDAKYLAGHCRFMLEDYKGAVLEWEKARKFGNRDCLDKLDEAYFKLGNQFQEEKQYGTAVACYTKSLEITPDDINVLYNRGISYLSLGDNLNACNDWLKIRDLGSADSKALIEEYCK